MRIRIESDKQQDIAPPACERGISKKRHPPTAVGKKNRLFVGGETTGQRAAIIHTMVGCARRHGHSPEAWLTDVLTRLPAMTNRDDLGALLPANWLPAAAATAAETRPACIA